MKNSIIATFLTLLIYVGLSPGSARAQVTVCNDVLPQDMISDFANWNWEVDRNDPLYCRTWALRAGNNSMGKVYGAPWLSPQNGVMYRIGAEKDYTRDKGWELLRMDFGGKTIVDVPYFILYNRYTSIIRTYFRLDNSAGTFNSGAIITMSHVDNTRVTPANSVAANPLLAPDQYLNQNQSNQVVSYVSKMSTQSGWIVGEFTMTYDPYFKNGQYQGSALQFQVYGIVENKIVLNGDFSFQTNTEEGFAIAGEKNGPNRVIKDTQSSTGKALKEFVSTGKTILGAVKSDDIDKFLANANKEALKLKASKNSKTSALGNDLANTFKPLSAGNLGGFGQVISAALSFSSTASGALGIIGSLAGVIWPDASSKPSFVPTVSKGSIKLTGSITTEYPLRGVICQIPGTQHSNYGSTLPYYDNALGVFNLKRALAVDKTPYDDRGGQVIYLGKGPANNYPLPIWSLYDSYEVKADLDGEFNQAAGLELVSAEAALISEVPDTLSYDRILFNSGYEYIGRSKADLNDLSYSYDDGSNGYRNDSYITAALNAGTLLQTQIDNGQARAAKKPSILQTRFVSFSCAKNLFLVTIRGAKTYLRVKVVLKSSNSTQPQPLIYYIKDYDLAVTTTAPVSGRLQRPTPISNLVTLLGPYNFPVQVSSTQDIISSTSTATSFNTNSTIPSKVIAENSIAFVGDFSVVQGTEFVASIGLPTCGTTLITGNTQPWNYNLSAYRQVLAVSNAALESKVGLFPNPTTGAFSLLIKGYSGPATVTLFNTLGQQQFTKELTFRSDVEEKITPSNLAMGVYLVQIVTSEGTITGRLMVQ